jgi:hypothetical protein
MSHQNYGLDTLALLKDTPSPTCCSLIERSALDTMEAKRKNLCPLPGTKLGYADTLLTDLCLICEICGFCCLILALSVSQTMHHLLIWCQVNNDLGGSGCGLLKVSSWHLPRGTGKNHEIPQSGQPAFWLGFELKDSWIQTLEQWLEILTVVTMMITVFWYLQLHLKSDKILHGVWTSWSDGNALWL